MNDNDQLDEELNRLRKQNALLIKENALLIRHCRAQAKSRLFGGVQVVQE